MYGTIARIRIKPGMEQRLMETAREEVARQIPGFISQYVFKMDKGTDAYMLVVIFQDRESYFANANSPEQNEDFQRIMQFLDGEPEWNDGEIIFGPESVVKK